MATLFFPFASDLVAAAAPAVGPATPVGVLPAEEIQAEGAAAAAAAPTPDFATGGLGIFFGDAAAAEAGRGMLLLLLLLSLDLVRFILPDEPEEEAGAVSRIAYHATNEGDGDGKRWTGWKGSWEINKYLSGCVYYTVQYIYMYVYRSMIY